MRTVGVTSPVRGMGRGLAFILFALVLVSALTFTKAPRDLAAGSSAAATTSVTALPLLGGVYDPLDRYQAFVIAVRLDVARCSALPALPAAQTDLLNCVLVASDNIEAQVLQARAAPSSNKALDQAVFEFSVRALKDLRGLTQGNATETEAAIAARLRLKDLGTFVLLEACNSRKECLFERQAPVRAMEHAGLI